jgi:hypothetical protein
MNTNVSAQEVAAAWTELQALVEAEAKKARQPAPGQPRLQWSQASALLLIGPWQVEARFDNRSGFVIHFDRFGGGHLGAQNFELPPGTSPVLPETWTLKPVGGITKVFWRLDAQELPSDLLAPRIVNHLRDHYEKYKLAAIA